MNRIGLTTTVPMEIIYAANKIPVDLNNLFIGDPQPQALIEEAELIGFPRNVCSWIKGLYSTALKYDLKAVMAVTQGDCSNTHALMETWQLLGIEVIPFAFPFDRDYDLLKLQLEKIMEVLGVSWPEVKIQQERLNQVRSLIRKIDTLTWRENQVQGWENHLWLINCSDFQGQPEAFAAQAQEFIREAEQRKPFKNQIRLGYLGVPPIMDDLYAYLEERGGRVVYNEVQHQFAMLNQEQDLVEQYRNYTYPYGIFFRLEAALPELQKRQVDGIIHYAQSFCYRQIEDIIVRQKVDCPVLTLEGDSPNRLDARSKMRIDSFLEMLR